MAKVSFRSEVNMILYYASKCRFPLLAYWHISSSASFTRDDPSILAFRSRNLDSSIGSGMSYCDDHTKDDRFVIPAFWILSSCGLQNMEGREQRSKQWKQKVNMSHRIVGDPIRIVLVHATYVAYPILKKVLTSKWRPCKNLQIRQKWLICSSRTPLFRLYQLNARDRVENFPHFPFNGHLEFPLVSFGERNGNNGEAHVTTEKTTIPCVRHSTKTRRRNVWSYFYCLFVITLHTDGDITLIVPPTKNKIKTTKESPPLSLSLSFSLQLLDRTTL